MQARKTSTRKRKASVIRMAVLAIPLVLLLLLSQTAFAQNTYVITDGDRILLHTSSATDPAAILDEAGLELGADDTYTTQAGIGVSEITVQRSQTVTINNCGQILRVSSRDETVGDLLDRLGISHDGNTSLSVSLDAVTFDRMEIKISRTLRVEEVFTTSIPYEVTYCYDPSVPKGVETVLTKGQDGQVLCTAEVVYTNGQETGRTVVKETVTKQPVNAVISVGTGSGELAPGFAPEEPMIGDGEIILPSGERLTYTKTAAVKATAYHHSDPGCDMITSTGTTVRVGTVAVDPKVIPYGTRMFIVSDDGLYTYGLATAEDCGGSIKKNRIDLYYPTLEECYAFGIRNCTVYILGDAPLK